MKNVVVLFFLAMVVLGCKKGNSPVPILIPEKVVLVSPAQNSVCIEGNIISPTQSSIVFKWGPSQNTDNYELTLKNLITSVTTSHTTVRPELELTLLRSTPYSWFVTSKSSKSSGIAQSEDWRFFNSGPGIESYAPFPAGIISPIKGQLITSIAGKIVLDWEGADVDGDIKTYDVYLGTNSSPALLKSNIIESKLMDVEVLVNTGYFWKVITKDTKGNSSDSGIYSFKVN